MKELKYKKHWIWGDTPDGWEDLGFYKSIYYWDKETQKTMETQDKCRICGRHKRVYKNGKTLGHYCANCRVTLD